MAEITSANITSIKDENGNKSFKLVYGRSDLTGDIEHYATFDEAVVALSELESMEDETDGNQETPAN